MDTIYLPEIIDKDITINYNGSNGLMPLDLESLKDGDIILIDGNEMLIRKY